MNGVQRQHYVRDSKRGGAGGWPQVRAEWKGSKSGFLRRTQRRLLAGFGVQRIGLRKVDYSSPELCSRWQHPSLQSTQARRPQVERIGSRHRDQSEENDSRAMPTILRWNVSGREGRNDASAICSVLFGRRKPKLSAVGSDGLSRTCGVGIPRSRYIPPTALFEAPFTAQSMWDIESGFLSVRLLGQRNA